MYSFPDGAGMQLTTSVYYTESGKSIHKLGVTPDLEVAPTEEDGERDVQLEAALELLWQSIGYEPDQE